MLKQLIEMKITSSLLYVLASFLAVIFIVKLVFWLKTDEPIGRGSMLILALFITFLTKRNKYTYLLLGVLVIFCIAYKYKYHNWSGNLIVDFTSSLRLNSTIRKIPFLVYYFTLLLMILPSTRKLYFQSKKLN